MNEDDTFLALKRIPWEDAVRIMMTSRTPGFDQTKDYESQIPIILEYLTELAESLGWRIENFIYMNGGFPHYNDQSMNTFNGR